MKKERESSFELLRLLAQWTIIFYHLLMLFIVPAHPDEVIYKALWMPFHIGVLVFVLISGFFGIHPSVKGCVRLLSITFIYTVPALLLNKCLGGVNQEPLRAIFFISNTHFWFIRTYLFLYLISPILNKYFIGLSFCGLFHIIAVLGFISIYSGTMTNIDASIIDGKNIANFMFLYSLGYFIKRSRDKWLNFSIIKILAIYVILNIFIVIFYSLYAESTIGRLIWNLSFPYCSPILILNAAIVVIIFGKLMFHSKFINYVASSSLAIYLIHAAYLIRPMLGKITLWIDHYTNGVLLLTCLAIFSSIIMFFCVFIDKCLSLVWIQVYKFSNFIDNKCSQFYNK